MDSIFKSYNKKGVFNGTVLYGENGQEIFKGAYGYANFRNKQELATDSAFQLASVSKMFTAAAIMILKNEGMLAYDDAVTKYIPEFPYPEVSIRNLMNHRSGLSRYMSLADKYWDINKPINNEEVIGLFEKHQPSPYFSANDGFHYCNTNYALLASVVERVSGKSFDAFVKEKIFDPLGMTNSFVYNLKGKTSIDSHVPVGVPGYRYNGRRLVQVSDYYLNGVMGDKGVYSSVEDLFKFSLALDNGSLIPLPELEEAFTSGSPPYWKRKDGYGFGWRIKDDMDSTAYHFGWWKGFRTYFIRDMKNDRVLIALTNTHKGLSSQVLWDVIRDEDKSEDVLEVYHSLK
ncbi:MAG: serine hydrolase domain-containing protein [Bacteroidales bacterium]